MKQIIKSLSPLILGLAFFGAVYAANTAAKIQGVGNPACVNVSSNTWTAVPSTTTIKGGRGGILISAPPTTQGAFNVGLTSSAVQSPNYAVTVYLTQMVAGDYIDFPTSEFVYVFAYSTHIAAATQPLCYQEYTLDIGR